jgi:multiple RNA-binding domain-containing protein 1
VKDAPAPRPNKRRRLSDPTPDPGPSSRPHLPKAEKSGKTSAQAAPTSASSLDQFMDVMQPRTKKGPLWANEAKESHPVLPSVVPPEVDTTPDDNEAISDLEWIRRRTKQMSDASPDKVFEQLDDEHDHSTVPEEPKDPAKDTIMQTSRLFLRNLPFSCTEAELMELFQPFGEVAQVSLLPPCLTLRIALFLDDKTIRDIRSLGIC